MNSFKTPPIPERIRNLKCDHYENIFSFELNNQNLFGTETLLGDWDGVLLIVAKDFAPAEEVRRLKNSDIDRERIYRHNDGDGRYRTGKRTNTRLLGFAFGEVDSRLKEGLRNLDCGALYISACFFLKSGNAPSSSLSHWSPGKDVFEKSKEVFHFVLEHMPNVRAVACLGKDAEKLVSQSTVVETIQRFYLPHPRGGSDKSHQEGWETLTKTAKITVKDMKFASQDE